MTGRQREELLSLLADWVEAHPRPRVPTIAFWGRSYTPEEMLDEVRGTTDFGEMLGNFLFQKAEELGTTVEAIIRRTIENNLRAE